MKSWRSAVAGWLNQLAQTISPSDKSPTPLLPSEDAVSDESSAESVVTTESATTKIEEPDSPLIQETIENKIEDCSDGVPTPKDHPLEAADETRFQKGDEIPSDELLNSPSPKEEELLLEETPHKDSNQESSLSEPTDAEEIQEEVSTNNETSDEESKEEAQIPFIQQVLNRTVEGMDLSLLLKIKKPNPLFASVLGNRGVVICVDQEGARTFKGTTFPESPSFISFCEDRIASFLPYKYMAKDTNLTNAAEEEIKDIFTNFFGEGHFEILSKSDTGPFVFNVDTSSLKIPWNNGSRLEKTNTKGRVEIKFDGFRQEIPPIQQSTFSFADGGNSSAIQWIKKDFQGLNLPVIGHFLPMPFLMVFASGDTLPTPAGNEDSPFREMGRILWSEEDIMTFFDQQKKTPELFQQAISHMKYLIWEYNRLITRQVYSIFLMRRRQKNDWVTIQSCDRLYSTLFTDMTGDQFIYRLLCSVFDSYWGHKLYTNLAVLKPEDLSKVGHMRRIAEYW